MPGCSSHLRLILTLLCCAATVCSASPVRAEGDWEITPQSELALERGLQWLARNQGPQGNWESNDLGLVSSGALAFMAAGHMPGRGKYGDVVKRALEYVMRNAKPSGLLNIADAQRDMYNHGLATFILGQAYGMTSDARMGTVLDRSLKLIYNTQCQDGGWDYRARSQANGHDLSLAVMQAKAIRSAVDSGLEVPRSVVQSAIQSVRSHYRAKNGAKPGDPRLQMGEGQFTYNGGSGSTAMAAAGVVCMQEFGQYDDWRIGKSMVRIRRDIDKLPKPSHNGRLPFDAYTLYYVAQALYQVGGDDWREAYPALRSYVVGSQFKSPGDLTMDGHWDASGHVSGKPGKLYGTSVACFVLAIPNRYLPILQEGRIEGLRQQIGE